MAEAADHALVGIYHALNSKGLRRQLGAQVSQGGRIYHALNSKGLRHPNNLLAEVDEVFITP